MARVRMPDVMLESWDDADIALKDIAEAENAKAEIEAEMNRQINMIKEAAEKAVKPHTTLIAERNKQLKSFAEVNRVDFGKAKSKKLTFGELGFRASSKVVIKQGTIAQVIKNLRKLGMADCINIKESINKDSLKTYSEDKIVKAGASLKKEDTFWYETDQQELPQVAE